MPTRKKDLKKKAAEQIEAVTGIKSGSGGGIGLKDAPLFGEDDEIINALEMESKEVKEEIGRCNKNLVRLQAGIGYLEERAALLKKALDTMRKRQPKKAPKETPCA